MVFHEWVVLVVLTLQHGIWVVQHVAWTEPIMEHLCNLHLGPRLSPWAIRTAKRQKYAVWVWHQSSVFHERTRDTEKWKAGLIMLFQIFIFRFFSFDEIVTNVDIAPTLLDIAGIAKPARMNGRSLLDLFALKKKKNNAYSLRPWRDTVLIERG